jgi:hypothetical protein
MSMFEGSMSRTEDRTTRLIAIRRALLSWNEQGDVEPRVWNIKRLEGDEVYCMLAMCVLEL